MAEPTRVAGRNGGALVRHPRGSNGGVHRGPDLKPLNFVRSMLLKAATDAGYLARDPYQSLPGKQRLGAQQRKRGVGRHSFIHNVAQAIQGIALDAAGGNEVARGQLLRLVHDFHEMLQPAQDEAKGGGGPVFSRFGRQTPRPSAPPPAPESPPAHPGAAMIDKDGTEYVEAE